MTQPKWMDWKWSKKTSKSWRKIGWAVPKSKRTTMADIETTLATEIDKTKQKKEEIGKTTMVSEWIDKRTK